MTGKIYIGDGAEREVAGGKSPWHKAESVAT
jgi:hypothetical protein